MKKLSFAALACFINIICICGQRREAPKSDSTRLEYRKMPSAQKSKPENEQYVNKKLTFEEANLVSGYYSQDGNHSAVTGGIGTEKLSDIANTFDLKLSNYVKKDVKMSWGAEIGVDHYTSASSDNIITPAQQQKAWQQPIYAGSTSTTSSASSSGGRGGRGGRGSTTGSGTIIGYTTVPTTSASRSDTRFYPSLNWSIHDEKRGIQLGVSGSFSTEYDYKSKGAAINFTKTSKDQNREFNAKLQAFFDTWMVIYPYELKPAGYGDGSDWDRNPVSYSPRNSYEAAFSFAQVINKRLQMAILSDVAYQEGLLATKYQRVYFNDGSVHSETLPDTRLKIPVAVRASYFAHDRLILRGYYRFYKDNWGTQGNTFNLETPVKLTNFISISPFYRYYTQNGAKYFAPYQVHTAADEFYSSDYDLSSFNSQYFGAGIRLSPPNGLLGMQHWNMLEIRYGHYKRSDGLASNNISLNIKFK